MPLECYLKQRSDEDSGTAEAPVLGLQTECLPGRVWPQAPCCLSKGPEAAQTETTESELL